MARFSPTVLPYDRSFADDLIEGYLLGEERSRRARQDEREQTKFDVDLAQSGWEPDPETESQGFIGRLFGRMRGKPRPTPGFNPNAGPLPLPRGGGAQGPFPSPIIDKTGISLPNLPDVMPGLAGALDDAPPEAPPVRVGRGRSRLRYNPEAVTAREVAHKQALARGEATVADELEVERQFRDRGIIGGVIEDPEEQAFYARYPNMMQFHEGVGRPVRPYTDPLVLEAVRQKHRLALEELRQQGKENSTEAANLRNEIATINAMLGVARVYTDIGNVLDPADPIKGRVLSRSPGGPERQAAGSDLRGRGQALAERAEAALGGAPPPPPPANNRKQVPPANKGKQPPAAVADQIRRSKMTPDEKWNALVDRGYDPETLRQRQ